MKKQRKTPFRLNQPDLYQRSFPEIQRIIRERHGWVMTKGRVQQICAAAEAKLRVRLAELVANGEASQV
jgi:hypothetical protein